MFHCVLEGFHCNIYDPFPSPCSILGMRLCFLPRASVICAINDPTLNGFMVSCVLCSASFVSSFWPYSDLDRILHEEQSSNEGEGWKFMSRTETAEVWRKSEPDKPVHLIKVTS